MLGLPEGQAAGAGGNAERSSCRWGVGSHVRGTDGVRDLKSDADLGWLKVCPADRLARELRGCSRESALTNPTSHHCDDNATDSASEQLFCGFLDCGSRRHHVVGQQQRRSAPFGRDRRRESTFEIFSPLCRRQRRLQRCAPRFFEYRSEHGRPQAGPPDCGERLGGVVAASQRTEPVSRDGDNAIDWLITESLFIEIPGQLTEGGPEIRPLMWAFGENTGELQLVLVDAEPNHVRELVVLITAEWTFRLVAEMRSDGGTAMRAAGERCAGEFFTAGSTEACVLSCLIARDFDLTERTARRIQKIECPAEPLSHGAQPRGGSGRGGGSLIGVRWQIGHGSGLVRGGCLEDAPAWDFTIAIGGWIVLSGASFVIPTPLLTSVPVIRHE